MTHMKNAQIQRLALALLLILTPAAGLAQTSFPQLPDTAVVVNGLALPCPQGFTLYGIIYDTTGQGTFEDRVEVYLENHTLVAVIVISRKTREPKEVFVLRPDGSIEQVDYASEAGKGCDNAQAVIEAKGSF